MNTKKIEMKVLRVLCCALLVCLLAIGTVEMSAASSIKVTITYAGNSVKVSQPKNKKIKVTHTGAKVVVDSQVTDKEVEYVLKGESADGSFELNGKYKAR